MTDRDRLLFANDAFYAAFNAGDADAMAQVWVTGGPCFCLHPGWPAVVGLEAVMQSWSGIFSGGGAPQLACRGAVAEVSEGVGVVLCYEVIEQAVLAATNLFRREAGIWRLFHHHAGPCQQPPEEILREEAAPSVQ